MATLAIARDRPRLLAGALMAGLAGASCLSLSLGAVSVPLRELGRAITDTTHPLHAVVWQVRMPRIAVAALVGASLAVAGVLVQTVVRNPLADPGLLGVTAGAGLAALLAIVLVPEHAVLLPLIAFGGALASTAAVLLLAWSGGTVAGPLRIILSGVAMQAVLVAGITLVTFFFAERAPAFVAFTIGSLHGSGWREVGIVGVPTMLGLGVVAAATRVLDVLLLDDATALGVGLPVRTARFLAAAAAALLAAGAVSVAGLVGFVGLVVPNALRVLVGAAHHRVLPLAVLGGAILLVLADLVARTVAAPLELLVGALLALIGGPYFLVILWRRLP